MVEPAALQRTAWGLASPAMREVLGAVGRALVTVGLLLLLFVAYQLWGTGIYQARAQNDLQSQFEQAQREAGTTTTTTATTAPTSTTTAPSDTTTTTLAPLAAPPEGDVVARIGIPKIGIDQFVVEGVNVDDLRKGPGHYPTTQMPGHEGNSAIAGHRTTYGAPFRNIDQLEPGDRIELRMPYGRFTYRVDRTKIVPPTETSVTDRVGHDQLILSACHPLYSAAKRIVVFARLAGAEPR